MISHTKGVPFETLSFPPSYKPPNGEYFDVGLINEVPYPKEGGCKQKANMLNRKNVKRRVLVTFQ